MMQTEEPAEAAEQEIISESGSGREKLSRKQQRRPTDLTEPAGAAEAAATEIPQGTRAAREAAALEKPEERDPSAALV